ncbi:DUF3658 domain-containing protein [Rhodoferax sp.]|uniref:DUF3658 domain-containing protein n=1 Tax=Rhodoferax sp. TaxID=50421 RepID=UPI00374DA8C3
MNDVDQYPPDGEMSPEQTRVAASLSPELIERIDACLLSFVVDYNRKVARVVGSTMMDKNLRVPGLPDLFYRDRVKVLVEKDLIVSEGNLEYMRYSEVRLLR